MSNVLEGLTSGVFEAIKNFITSLSTDLINGFLNFIGSLLPDFTIYLPYISNMFNLVIDFCLFILDASMIQPVVFTYLIGTLLFRLNAPIFAYFTKLVINWWHALAP